MARARIGHRPNDWREIGYAGPHPEFELIRIGPGQRHTVQSRPSPHDETRRAYGLGRDSIAIHSGSPQSIEISYPKGK